jgi:heme/copper-type cytochrome/quinol oxidase subunit 3
MAETTAPVSVGGGGGSDRDAEDAGFYHEAGLNAAWTGSRLAIGALSFLFGAFAFAYFYLRSLNSHGMWLPSGFIRPHMWSGTLIMGLVVLSAVTQTAALQRIKAGDKSTWQRGAIAALVLGLAAVGLQIWDLLSLPFYPGGSGFASVFTGYSPVYLLIALAAMVWLEILVARSASIPGIHFVEQPPTYPEAFALQRFQAALSAFTAVWNYLAVVAVLFWVLFYLL